MTYPPQNQAPQASTGNVFSTLAFVFGGVSFIFLPILFGPAALVMGIISKVKHESRSTAALIVSIVGFIGGMILGAIVFSAAVS